jgi:hypothetical protein
VSGVGSGRGGVGEGAEIAILRDHADRGQEKEGIPVAERGELPELAPIRTDPQASHTVERGIWEIRMQSRW